MLQPDDIEYLKNRLPFWNRLSKSETDLLCTNTRHIHYSKDENIYGAARECIGILLVKSGEIRTYILSEDGREITLFRGNEGHVCVLSATCLLKSITFDVNIDAEQPTEAMLINASIFEQLQNKHEFVENFALKVTAERFSDVIWVMEQICFMSFDRRLAIFLLDEFDKIGSDELAITHEKMAHYMGSAREVVSRMLKYFEKEGFVLLKRGSVKLINKDALRKLV